jgi:hypothetical protein
MTEPLLPFEAAKLKVCRAYYHIGSLRASITTFLAGNPFAIIVEQPEAWAKLDKYVWTARIKTPVPKEFATAIGDVVHNLRTALDLLASDLVRLNGKDTNNVYFPFAINARKLEEQIKKKNFDRAGQDAVRLLRTYKPYTVGNSTLRALHDLDIQDKHQALIPAISTAQMPPCTLLASNGEYCAIPSWKSAIPRDGYWLVAIPMVANMTLGTKIQANFTLVFDQDTPFAGGEVLPTLSSLNELVASIIESFAAISVGKAFPTSAPTAKGHPLVKTLIVQRQHP